MRKTSQICKTQFNHSSPAKYHHMLRSIVAIVSGGSSGLGAATALSIVQRGGRVVVADLPGTQDNFLRLAAVSCAEVHGVEHVAEGLICESKISREIKGPVMAFAEADVRNEQNIKDALDLAENRFGEPVNTVINCAGICPARRTISKSASAANGGNNEVKVHSLSDFREALEINTLGTFNLSRLAAERMLKRDADADGLRGCIINTASIAAFEGQEGERSY
jgi:3-hydroxyacyl-CoA dehydrogenase/3-hydroxy-2-methylbutyryl-CoA dehydrogenase